MKILALVTDAFGGHGGIARYNRDFLQALLDAESGSEIVVLPRIIGTNEKMPSNITYRRSPRNKMGYILNVLKTLLKEGPFDFVFCGHLNLAPVALLASRLKNIQFWLQIYGVDAWQKPAALWKWSAEQADLVTSISRYTRRRFLEWAHVNPTKVRILPVTVGENFKPGSKPQFLLKRYGLEDKKILLTVSRLSSQEKYKGHDRILRVLPQLLTQYSNLAYVIVGSGDDESRLRTITEEHGLNKAVKFLGEIDNVELVDHYRMADLFVMPSTGEGFGIVFLEAIRCGIPVIAANVDGSVDALLEGRTGRLVNPSDTEQLREAILDSLTSKKNFSEVSDQFDYSNFTHFVKNLAEKRLTSATGKNG